MIGAVAIFTVGSGICGSATTTNILIGGRAIQGLGAAGINSEWPSPSFNHAYNV